MLWQIYTLPVSIQPPQCLHSFFTPCSSFRRSRKKLQAEVDSVIGRERLPTVKYRRELPYTNAVWKEALRFTPAVPLALPRCSSEDQIVYGYFIPKGSVINPHFGSMLNDPKIWGDPKVFRPERFLSPDAGALPDPTVLVFGFRTRMCPGMHFADRTGFHLAVCVMALFNVSPLPGQTVPWYEEFEYTKTFFRLPVVFEYAFTPRDKKAEYLLASLALREGFASHTCRGSIEYVWRRRIIIEALNHIIICLSGKVYRNPSGSRPIKDAVTIGQ